MSNRKAMTHGENEENLNFVVAFVYRGIISEHGYGKKNDRLGTAKLVSKDALLWRG
jgi:hypothetical protein